MAVPLIALLAALVLIPVGIVVVLYLVVPFFKGIGWLCRQIGRFVIGEVGDCLRIVGAILTQVVFFPLIIANVLIGRWSAAAHFGRAFQSELKTISLCIYRIAIGHPARLLCLTALTDGLENRLPEVVAGAPTADKPHNKKTGQFEGYTIVGSLPGGGSGGKLYVAEPDAMKRAIFERAGQGHVRQVVIKTFSLRDGSSLPQIVRESRALEAAKKLGLVLEHELTDERFYYVTEYVPGESLGLVTQRLHAMSGGDGLGQQQLRTAMAVASDLLRTLDTYHRGGLWHKDVKPDNIIVDGKAAHLVDFGLVTPLRSGMTLTTHGTEYFRDPELVRLALKGVKVHQVDGARFDVYAAGAVLFSMIENSFPAHGGLSQISKRCPEALRWVVRRAMTDYDKRYPSAAAMLADLDVVRLANDAFAVKPIDLPSMRGETLAGVAIDEEAPIRPAVAAVGVGQGSDTPGYAAPAAGSPVGRAGTPAERRRPNIRVNRWWSGGYVVDGDRRGSPAASGISGATPDPDSGFIFNVTYGRSPSPKPAWTPRNPGRSAREQVENARARAQAARDRAKARMHGRRKTAKGDFSTLNLGVGVAVFLFLAACIAAAALMFTMTGERRMVATVEPGGGVAGVLDAGFATGELAEAPPLAEPAVARGPQVVVNGVRVSAPAPVPPAPPTVPAVVHGEKVLVISDVVPSTPTINAAIHRLGLAGFTVLGNYPGNPAEEVDLQKQLDLEVSAKQARGLGQLDSKDTTERLGLWLAEQSDLDLLVWFTRVDPQGSAVRYFVISPGAALPGTGSEEVLEAGMRAMHSAR